MKQIILVLLLLVLYIPAYSQTSIFNPSYNFFRMNLGDMRAKGMGNTEVLSTSGSNATFYNPALLTKVTSFRVQINGKMGLSSSESSNGGVFEYNLDSGNKTGFSAVSIANSWTHKDYYTVAYGVGLLVQHDLSLSNDITQQWKNGDDFYSIKESYNGNGGITTICPSLAIGYGDFLVIGVAGNAAVSSEFDEQYSKDSKYVRLSDGYSYESNYGRNQEGYISGAGYVAALRVKIYRVQAGVVHRSKLKYNFRDISYINFYSGQESAGYFGDYSYSIPSMTAVGVSAQLMENFLIVGEYQTCRYSELKDYSSYLNESDYNDGYAQRFGFEYCPIEWLKFRGGAFQESIYLFSQDQSTPNDIKGLTAGIGYLNRFFQIDMGLEYYRYKYDLEIAEEISGNIEGSRVEIGLTLSLLL